MRIEKIELIGFKSFAEKTTFNLHPGITCIVGPNGSGKSNIVDSFRWVLGEQSAKSLRGEKMEEVIFNGSATKKPRGMSEVSLLLALASAEQNNGDSGSASVARRLYRSGDSEYLLNKVQCRLKDVKDLFLDTGLEVRSYSILEQGKMSDILNSKPQERRFIIEEVAGVMKYKVRRAEALSKLESSRGHLLRISDIIAEIRRQLNALDRQVRKAERFKRLSAEMREIELKLAKREYVLLNESLNSIIADNTATREKEAAVRADLNSIENNIETGRIHLLEKEKVLEALGSELQGLEREIAEKEKVIAVAAAEGSTLREALIKLSTQDAELEAKALELQNSKGELNSNETRLNAEIEGLRQELNTKTEIIKDMETGLSEKEEGIELKRKEVFRVAEALSHLRNDIGRISTSLDNLDKKALSAVKEAEASKGHILTIEGSIRDTDGSLIAKNNELLLLNEKRAVFSSGIEELTFKLSELRGKLSAAREAFASGNARLASLREIISEEASADIMLEAGKLHIIASIAEVIEVDEVYEKAIENALAEKVNGLIMLSTEDVSAAVEISRQKAIARTVLVPLNAAPLTMNETAAPVPADGIIGRASDFVRVRESEHAFSPVIKAFLDKIFIVKDLPTAFSLLQTNSGLTFATAEGEIIEASGAVIVGGTKGVLKKKRETRELETLLDQQSTEIIHLEAALADMETAIQEQRSSLKDIEMSVNTIEKEISLIRLTAENQTEEKERINRRLANLSIEYEEALREGVELRKLLTEKELEAESTAAGKATAEEMVTGMLKASAKNKEAYEVERSSLNELRDSLTACKERIESVRKEIDSTAKMLEENTGMRSYLAEEKVKTEARITQCGDEVNRNDDTVKGLVVRADSLKKTINDDKEIISGEKEDINRLEQQLKALRSSLDLLTARISEAEVSIMEYSMRLENLTGGIRQNYGIELNEIETEPLAQEEEERLIDLRAKIQELGPVNLGTLEEYEELKGRYEFQTNQVNDLNKSIAELEEAITKINSTTRKRLREAFEQLNAKFTEVFKRLFGGGNAELVLTDKNNILDTGIDIIAQPPGKKLQNINLLSGGEKALTALSILFASFLIKPAPICVLDEVDAPLDESNVQRFAAMLRELSASIQFIVVTHNRVTMEAADYIYGITMEEPGISKVISMHLTEA